MAEPEIQNYLTRLKASLAGRLPAHQVDAIVAESASHLEDLAEDYAQNPASAIQTKAVEKFGSPERMARRLLRELSTPPTVWQAARWPLVIATLVGVQGFLMQWIAVRYVGPYALDSALFEWMPTIMRVESVLFIYFCFRGRRLLVKPILAFSAAMLVLWLGVTTGTHLSIYGQEGGHIGIRKSDVAEYVAQADQRIKVLEEKASRLEKGAQLFAGNARSVPPIFGRKGAYATPNTLTYFFEKVDGLHLTAEPLFVTQTVEMSTMAASWEQAQAEWHQAPKYLAEAQRRLKVERHTAAYVAQAQAESFFVQAWWLSPRIFFIALSCMLLLLYMNLIGWALAQVWSRIVWPRRRYAR